MIYFEIFGDTPPFAGGLDVDRRRLYLFDEPFGSISESGGGVGGADQIELPVGLRIFQYCQSVIKGVEAIGDSVINATVNIRLSQKPMNYFGGCHEIPTKYNK